MQVHPLQALVCRVGGKKSKVGLSNLIEGILCSCWRFAAECVDGTLLFLDHYVTCN